LPQPREARPDGTRELPPPASSDPIVEVPVGPKHTSTGTGFSLDDRGTWMTARHVAQGCSRIGIVTAPRTGMLVRSVYIHPSADLAVLRTDRGAPHVTFSPDQLRVGQTGYHFGFPRGEPGAVQSSLLGRATIRAQGRYALSEPTVVWAERERVPEGDERLSGMSGGPVFDESGRVIGVTVVASLRRGRVFTTDPSSISAALESANVPPAAEYSAVRPRLSVGTWIADGDSLRHTLSVAKVVCLVD
jgi:S1-C subfamily serine protease